jgi:predicted ABC-type ATPase
MKLIGLTGAIGSGKSSVSALFARKGAVIIDGDGIAKQLQQKGSATLQKMGSAMFCLNLESWIEQRLHTWCSETQRC